MTETIVLFPVVVMSWILMFSVIGIGLYWLPTLARMIMDDIKSLKEKRNE